MKWWVKLLLYVVVIGGISVFAFANLGGTDGFLSTLETIAVGFLEFVGKIAPRITRLVSIIFGYSGLKKFLLLSVGLSVFAFIVRYIFNGGNHDE